MKRVKDFPGVNRVFNFFSAMDKNLLIGSSLLFFCIAVAILSASNDIGTLFLYLGTGLCLSLSLDRWENVPVATGNASIVYGTVRIAACLRELGFAETSSWLFVAFGAAMHLTAWLSRKNSLPRLFSRI